MAELLSFLRLVEARLNEISSKLPAVPTELRNLLVKVLPWLAVFVAVVTFLGAYRLLSAYLAWNDAFGNYAAYFGVRMPGMGIWGWVRIIAGLAVSACLALGAKGLFAQKKDGWDWLFRAQLLSALSAVLFFDIGSLVGTAIGLYLSFQIRPAYSE